MTLGEFEKLTKDIPKDTRLYWCEQDCNVDTDYWDIYHLTYQKNINKSEEEDKTPTLFLRG